MGRRRNVGISPRQREILVFVEQFMREHGYPPSVREIGDAVGLNSPSTVHTHLNNLEARGYIRRDPSKPRTMTVSYDPLSGAMVEQRPMRYVPLVGDVAAGTDVLAEENIEESLPLPTDLTGEGELFILRVRGESMIEAGIFDSDLVVVRSQDTANAGDIVVAGIPGEEATVKTFTRSGDDIVLAPANEAMSPLVFSPNDVKIYGKVVSLLRRF